MTLPIKIMTSVLKIRLAVILVLMSLSTFITADTLHILTVFLLTD